MHCGLFDLLGREVQGVLWRGMDERWKVTGCDALGKEEGEAEEGRAEDAGRYLKDVVLKKLLYIEHAFPNLEELKVVCSGMGLGMGKSGREEIQLEEGVRIHCLKDENGKTAAREVVCTGDAIARELAFLRKAVGRERRSSLLLQLVTGAVYFEKEKMGAWSGMGEEE